MPRRSSWHLDLRLAHEPLGWRPTTLVVTIRRYQRAGCRHVVAGHQEGARAERSCRGVACGGHCGIEIQHLTDARVAEGLDVAWDTANDDNLAEGQAGADRRPQPLDGAKVLGVDKPLWRHTRRGDNYLTVIIDRTGIRDGTEPARLLNMVEGRSKQAFETWLADREEAWRNGVQVVAMDGFTGF